MKKILLLMLTLVMSVATWAEDTHVSTYEELNSALTTGAVIDIVFDADIVWDGTYATVYGRTKNIDLNNHTLSQGPNATGEMIDLMGNSTMTVSNGNIQTSTKSFVTIFGSTLNLHNVNSSSTDYYPFYISSNGIINFYEGNSVVFNYSSYAFYCSSTGMVNFLSPITLTNTNTSNSKSYFGSSANINLGGSLKFVNADGTDIDMSASPNYWGRGQESISVVADNSQCAVGNHTMIHFEAVSPTCTDAGNIEYYYCHVCDHFYNDEAGNVNINKTSIPALGHDVSDGEHCSRCDYVVPSFVKGNNILANIPAVSGSLYYASGYNLYRFVAPGDGTLNVVDDGDGDTYGALISGDRNTILIDADYNGAQYNCFGFSYEVTEGTVYYIGVRSYSGSEISSQHTITLSGSCFGEMEELTITDGEPYTVSKSATVTNFTYIRNVKNSQVDKWQALYIPFQMSYNDYVTVAAAESNSITCSSVERKYSFVGTYEPVTNMMTNGYAFLYDGMLCDADNDGQTLKAQRWYLTIQNLGSQWDEEPSSARARTIKIRVIGDDSTTGIEEIGVTTSMASGNNMGVYDLQGRKVSVSQKGINIIRQATGGVKKVMNK